MSDMENMQMTDADQASYDSVSQILKAAIHYVDPTSGRALAILAKSIELNHIMEYLDQDSVAACGVDNNQIPPGEVLKDLRKYCGPKERAQLDRCLNMINMLSVVQAMANTPSDNEGSSYDMASIMAAFNNMSNASPNKNNQPVNNYTPPPPQPQNPAQQEDYMNHLKSMLTPEQLQLFNSIAAGMNQ